MAEEGGGLPGSQRASDQAGRYREAMEKIRQRTDYTSKALATVGTAAVAGIGYTKLADVFPWGGPWEAFVALALGVILMIVAVLYLVFRFARASESVFTSSDPEETFERNKIKDTDEQNLIKKVYAETAARHGLDSLDAYERQARRFERIAERSDKERAAELRARADQILNEVLAAQDRAAALLLRRRAHDAVFGRALILCVIAFVIGWYGTAIGADALQSEHTDQVALAKACAEARAAEGVVKDDIPGICGTQLQAEKEEEEKKTAAKARRAGITALAAAVETCQNTAEENKEDEKKACGALERALTAALGKGGQPSVSPPPKRAG
jgi:hypothetical protein